MSSEPPRDHDETVGFLRSPVAEAGITYTVAPATGFPVGSETTPTTLPPGEIRTTTGAGVTLPSRIRTENEPFV